MKKCIVVGDDKASNDGHAWSEVSSNKALRLKTYRSDVPKLPTRHKAVIVMPFSRDEFKAVLYDDPRRTKWDAGVVHAAGVPLSDPAKKYPIIDGTVEYAATASKYGVSSRDYIMACGLEELPGGGGIFGACGVEEHPAFPPRAGAIRALPQLGGFYVVPVPAPADAPEALRGGPWVSLSFVMHAGALG